MIEALLYEEKPVTIAFQILCREGSTETNGLYSRQPRWAFPPRDCRSHPVLLLSSSCPPVPLLSSSSSFFSIFNPLSADQQSSHLTAKEPSASSIPASHLLQSTSVYLPQPPPLSASYSTGSFARLTRTSPCPPTLKMNGTLYCLIHSCLSPSCATTTRGCSRWSIRPPSGPLLTHTSPHEGRPAVMPACGHGCKAKVCKSTSTTKTSTPCKDCRAQRLWYFDRVKGMWVKI